MVRNNLRLWFAGTATCLSLALTGCAARPAGVAANPLLKHDAVTANQQLKDPQRLHLTHAALQEQLGNATSARQSYEFVLQKNKESVDAIVGLARLDQLGGRTEEAELGFLKALEVDPNSPNALASAGQFYATQEKWDDAIKMLQAAMVAQPANKTYEYNLAIFLARSGDVAAARPHFVNTVGDAESHYNVGYILKESGDLAAAEQEFLQALVKDPDLKNAKVLLGEIRQQRQDEIALAATTESRSTQVSFQSNGQAAGTIQAGHSVPAGQTRFGSQPVVTADARVLKMETSSETVNALGEKPSPIPAGLDDRLTPRQREQLMNQLSH